MHILEQCFQLLFPFFSIFFCYKPISKVSPEYSDANLGHIVIQESDEGSRFKCLNSCLEATLTIEFLWLNPLRHLITNAKTVHKVK